MTAGVSKSSGTKKTNVLNHVPCIDDANEGQCSKPLSHCKVSDVLNIFLSAQVQGCNVTEVMPVYQVEDGKCETFKLHVLEGRILSHMSCSFACVTLRNASN